MDESVGRLREALRELGLSKKTVFVYMGDNGFQFGDHGLIDKRTAYEAVPQEFPLIVAAEGVIPGGQRLMM